MRSILLIVIISVTAFAISAQSDPSTMEQVKQLTADLQRSPDDSAIREKIIKLTRNLSKLPEIPEDARRQFVRAGTFLTAARTSSDFESAIKAYQDALLIAPWWPEAYSNLAIASDAAGQYDGAIAALRLYLLTLPSQADARAATDKVYEIETKMEMSASKKSQDAEKERQKSEEEQRQKLQDLSGKWGEVGFSGKVTGYIQLTNSGGTWTIAKYSGSTLYTYQPTNVVVGGGRVAYDLKYGYRETMFGHTDVTLSADGQKLTGTYQTREPGYERSAPVTFIRMN